MAIFSRRDIQKILDDNKIFLKSKQLQQHVDRLNNSNDVKTQLATEWEVVLLNIISKLGILKYEDDFPGKRKPDIYLNLNHDGTDFVLIADITTVSDTGLHEKNPRELFDMEVNRLIKKYGSSPNCISTEIKGNIPRKSSNRNNGISVSLELKGFQDILRREFIPFIKENILKNLESSDCFLYKNNGVEFSIKYDPQQQFRIGNYPSYTVPYDIDKNPLMNALSAKRKQLKNCGESGIKGVFVCDGGCDVLKNETTSGYKAGEIICKFLREQESVDFVCLLEVKDNTYNLSGQKQEKEVKISTFIKNEENNQLLLFLSEKIKKHMLTPVKNAVNAKYSLSAKNSYFTNSFYGGYKINMNKIEFSLKTLLRVLTGDIPHDTFKMYHAQLIKVLKLKLEKGYKLENISIERMEHEDDDYVSFEFSDEVDAAISKYHL